MLTATATADATGNATAQLVSSVGMLVVVMVIFYFMLIRPQNKKEKEQKKMRDSIQIGDEVTTIGGIVGIVVRKNDDTQTVVIETGGDRSKIRVKIWAISENLTQHDEPDELGKKKECVIYMKMSRCFRCLLFFNSLGELLCSKRSTGTF